jgi:CheY-like chemotaxis protein
MSKRRIIVVEDEGIVSLDIQTKLTGLDYEVAAAVATGEEAVKQASNGQKRPNLLDTF